MGELAPLTYQFNTCDQTLKYIRGALKSTGADYSRTQITVENQILYPDLDILKYYYHDILLIGGVGGAPLEFGKQSDIVA